MSKFKKITAAIVSLTMAATMAATISACKENGNPNEPGNQEKPEVKSYSITYERNGHGTVLYNPDKSDKLPTPLAEPTDPDWDFKGWYYDSNFNERAYAGDAITKDVTLYAKWEAKTPATQKYTVTFNVKGVGTAPADLTCEGVLPELPPPTDIGDKTFYGWYYNSDCTQRAEAGDKIDSDVILYASWEKATSFTITFYMNDHGARPEPVKDVTKIPNDLHIPVAAGYAFLGWYLNPACTEPVIAGTPLTQDITVYAKWEKKSTTETAYTVTFKPENGTPDKYSQVVENGKILMEDPVREGYRFNGWIIKNDDGTTTAFDKESDVITGDTTLWATWVKIEFTISFFMNGHGTRPDPITNVTHIPSGLPFPTPSGWKFLGWHYDEECTLKANVGDALTKDTVLYAKWEKDETAVNTYTVTFKYGNGNPDNTSQVEEGGKITAHDPTREGYDFMGWEIVNTDGSTQPFDKENDVIMQDTVLQAVWQAQTVEPHDVTFIINGHGTQPDVLESITSLPTLPILSEEGWTFGGWYHDENLTKPAAAGDKITADTNLYAKWTKKSSVTEDKWTSVQADFTDSKISGFNSSANKTVEEVTVDRFTYAKGVYFEGPEAGLKIAKGNINTQMKKDAIKFTMSGEENAVTFTAKTAAKSDGSQGNGSVYVYKEGVDQPIFAYNFTTLNKPQPVTIGIGDEGKIASCAQKLVLQLEAGTYYIGSETNAVRVGNLVIHENMPVAVTSYDVTFIYDNGAENTVVAVKEGGTVQRPATPVKAGYTFRKWVLVETDGTEKDFNFSSPITCDIVLKAVYEKIIVDPNQRFTVTFDSAGGSVVSPITDIKSGETIQKPADPALEGYTFLGWYYQGTSQAFAFGTDTVTNNLTLVAKWQKNDGGDSPVDPSVSYIVTFNANGHGTAPEAATCNGTITNLPPMSAEGWIFGGWFRDAACTQSVSEGSIITGDITLWAKWSQLDAKLSSVAGNNESITIIWNGKKQPATSVEYKLYGSNAANDWIQADTELIRETGGEIRADIVGLKAGDYSVRVTLDSSNTVTVDSPVTVSAYDRSGYAHFKYNEGVGAYNNDGTLKDNAIVIYVTEENKDVVMKEACAKYGLEMFQIPNYGGGKDWGGKDADGIGWWLNNNQYTSNNAGSSKNKRPSNTYDPVNGGKLGFKSTDRPVVVRFIGEVTSPEGLTAYNQEDEGGGVDDNGHMARLKNLKNITLEGIGTDAIIQGWGFHFVAGTDAVNGQGTSFEVRNLTFDKYPEDAIGMEGQQSGGAITAPVERCWIHHNTFLPGYCANPAESDKAEGDGSCDFKRGQYLTCSYNYFEYCHKTNLIGSSDSSLQYNLTYHHNWWYQCGSRIPLTRQANVHFYNNYVYGDMTETSTPYPHISKPALSYVHSLRANCYLFSEGNYYEGSKNVVDGSGGSAKFYNNEYYANFNSDINSKVVNDREQAVSNNCKYQSTDYSKFDTDENLFYYDKANKRSDCLLDDAVTARAKVILNAGALGHGEGRKIAMNKVTPAAPVQVADEGETVITLPSSKNDTTVNGVVFKGLTGVSSGTVKGKGQIITFTLATESQIKVTTATSGDAAPELIGADGKVYASKFTGTLTQVLPAGTYVIASGMKDKEANVSSLSFSSTEGSASARIEAFKTAVEALPAASDVSLDNAQIIKEATAAYAALQSKDKEKLTQELSKYNAVVEKYNTLLVTDAINKIDAIGTVTKDSYAKINAAQIAYDAVPTSHKALVTNYSNLVAAQEAFANFAVQNVIDMITALPVIESISLTDVSAIAVARAQYEEVYAAYNRLDEGDGSTDSEQSKVTNRAKLLDGLKKLDQLELLQDFKDLLENVNKDGEVSLSEGAMLKTAYEKLTAAQQATLTAEEKAAYDAAMEKYNEAMNSRVVCNFNGAPSNAGVSVTGNYASGSYKINATGETFNKALKMESSTSVTFTTATEMKLTLYYNVAGKKAKVDGTSYAAVKDANGDCVIEVTLAAGTHTITKDNTSFYLIMMVLTPVA